jgi:accessory secretory protein Asp2
MHQNINVLYIGFRPISLKDCPEEIHVTQTSHIDQLGNYQVVIIDMILSPYEIEEITEAIPVYGCYITKEVYDYYQMGSFIYKKQAKMLVKYEMSFIKLLASRYFVEQKAKKISIRQIGVNRSFRGTISYEGRQYMTLQGDYDTEWTQTCYWKKGVKINRKYPVSLWLEYQKDENVHLQIFVEEIKQNTMDHICFEKQYNESMLDKPLIIDEVPYDGTLHISLYVKGTGKLKIGPLHVRQSRYEEGELLPGGERYNDDLRQECLFYYEPGNMKPPLQIHFSDYHQDESFEDIEMMRNMKTPFIIISDPRLDGGSFYIGSSQYEKRIKMYIQEKMEELHFTNKDLLFSGISMGSYGALYYGCDFSPNAIVVGQPLTNLGTLASNETIFRPEVFPTSLDVLKQNGDGQLDKTSVKLLDDRFWNKFDKATFSNTKIAVAYMKDDDYDKDAFSSLTTHAIGKDIMIYGKGVEGRHNDDRKAIFNWFLMQYKRIMEEDFKNGK